LKGIFYLICYDKLMLSWIELLYILEKLYRFKPYIL
jgi:hypothetical protein